MIQRAFLSFQRVRSDEAAAWLEAREPTPDLRQLYTPYLDHLTGTDPERAVELARSAQDAETRAALLRVVGRSWLRRDPEAAQAWLQGADLPAGVSEDILKTRPGARSISRHR